ncbi:uncharacterized protein K489DRAFT_125040 [Dissoconium aciculare CBS 342.82]|uniref:Secreted protein n=1 Tax=Dissoconium aciculare CBS 342.82 TaxID=1314786 RepID=A0A6J3MFL8_9PEZI|nr:uncharacterized protein K489DRAFT_125040 [Dissoconium aciculare CBS 342.82]KAF1826770.1 hypothetical protein K489DRAFT_125040 [Dissoconium aciculare CBS 342.82]
MSIESLNDFLFCACLSLAYCGPALGSDERPNERSGDFGPGGRRREETSQGWKARAGEMLRRNDRHLDYVGVAALHLLITTTKNTDDT